VSENPDLESSVTRILQRGANAFEAEDYPQAIQYYDKAFQVSSNECKVQRINILDSRAAAKEKNNDLKGSLLDLKQIIDLDPEVPKVQYISLSASSAPKVNNCISP
jgi:tetratricopeptide (TPR) repeat protein